MAAGVAIALLTLLIAVGCGTRAERRAFTRAGVATNSVVLVDTGDGRIVSNVRVHASPRRVAYGDGAFWTAVPEARLVVRIDARTHAVTRFRVGEDPFDVAVGG